MIFGIIGVKLNVSRSYGLRQQVFRKLAKIMLIWISAAKIIRICLEKIICEFVRVFLCSIQIV